MGSCAIGQFSAHAFMLALAKIAAFDFARCTAIVALNSAHNHQPQRIYCVLGLSYQLLHLLPPYICSPLASAPRLHMSPFHLLLLHLPLFHLLLLHLPLEYQPLLHLPLLHILILHLPLVYQPLLQTAAEQASSASQTKVLFNLWDVHVVKC